MKNQHFHQGEITLPKLGHFDDKLLHHSKILPHRIHLLHLIAEQQDNLQEIADLRDSGGGSVIEGITNGIATVLGSLTGSGLRLVRGIASGVKSVVNETTTVVAQTISGFGHILSFTNGISGLVLYILDFLIIAYLITLRVWGRQLNNRNLELQRELRVFLRNQQQEEYIPTRPPLRAQ